jgi:hypothetical protein
VIVEPGCEFLTGQFACGKIKNKSLLLINSRVYFEAVENQESLHRRVPNPLVPVNKGVVHDKGEAQSCGFGN